MSEPRPVVLVGTSLTAASRPVLAAAAALARAAGAQLFACHAFEAPLQHYAGAPFEIASYDASVYESQEELHREALAAQLAEQGIGPDDLAGSRVWLGSAHGVLLDVAAELQPMLIVVGASERGHWEERLLGSTADRVVRGARWPVLVVRGELPLPLRRIVAPVDMSPLSTEELHRGLAVLRDCGALAPTEVLFALLAPQPGAVAPFSHDELRAMAETGLADLCAAAPDWSRSFLTPVVRELRPAEAVFESLAAEPADLVLVGTHGRSGFQQFLVGSVTTELLRGAPSSLLVVSPAAAHTG